MLTVSAVGLCFGFVSAVTTEFWDELPESEAVSLSEDEMDDEMEGA